MNAGRKGKQIAFCLEVFQPPTLVKLAALGISVCPIAHPVALDSFGQYRLGDYLPKNQSTPAAFPSQTSLQEGPSQIERGRKRPCVEPRLRSPEPESLSPMSSDSRESQDLHFRKLRDQQQEPKSEQEEAQKDTAWTQQDQSNESRRREPSGTKRPFPWPESADLQPRLESSVHGRSTIGVHSILNPSDGSNPQNSKRHLQDLFPRNNDSGGISRNTMETLRLPTFSPSPQLRGSSSPLLAPISRSITVKRNLQPGGGSSVSPPHPPRRIITPVSPAVRHTSIGGNQLTYTGSGANSATLSSAAAGKVTVSQSPFVQELSAGVYSTPGHGRESLVPTGSAIEYSSVPRYSPPKLSVSIPNGKPSIAQLSQHSTPNIRHNQHNRHLSGSGGPATNPNSRTSSPNTPQSTYSSFTQSSPSLTSLLPPLSHSAPLASSTNSAAQSPFMGMDPLSRASSRMSGGIRHGDDHQSHVSYPGPNDLLNHAPNVVAGSFGGGPMIPVTIDLKSGSRSQAEKRKANSDASRRFRNRKKNEAALEQKIHQLNDQLQHANEERDFYRSERDFFRDALSQHVGSAQMPSRPPSPLAARRYPRSTTSPGDESSPIDQQQQQSVMGIGGELMSKSMSSQTSSSMASVNPSLIPGHAALSYASPAAGQQPPETWQNVGTPNSSYQNHPYPEDVRYLPNMR